MDLGLLFNGFFVLSWFANLIIFLGLSTFGYLIFLGIKYLSHYIKFKSIPTNELEYKYINVLEENKLLKQKIMELEDEQNQLFSRLLDQMKDK